MDYRFTEKEMAFKEEVAEFVRAQLPADWESRVLYSPGGYGTWPFAEVEFRAFYLEFNRKLGEKGWLSLAWPREFGGSNSMIKQAIVDDVTSYYRVPAGGAAQIIAGPTIIAVGSPKMKDQWLPRIARGEVSIWLGYSEPNAGSDLGALQTRAKDKGDHFVINGQKTWGTGAHATDYCWLLARTDPEAGKHAGATLFLVDNNTPGITIRPIINICQTHSFNEVFFDDVKVPKENVVGEVNRGFQHVMLALQYERLAVSTGAFRRFLEELVQYCRGNRRHGPPLAESPLIMAELGWMGLILPEEYGGSGLTFQDLAILLEVMGYYLCPSPFISTILGGALPILSHGNTSQKAEVLPKLAVGDMVLTMAVLEESGAYAAKDIEMSAVKEGDDFVLNGCKLFVPDALKADLILCLARTSKPVDPEQGLTVFLLSTKTPGLTIKPMKTISHDSQSALVLENVKVPSHNVLGEESRGWPVILEGLSGAALGRSAEMVGGAQAAFDLATIYAKERIQFDRLIGSFPAIQSYFTDMWIMLTGARMMTMKAATNLGKGIATQGEIAMAKAKAGEAYRLVTTLSHQIFGAIGFCLEHDLHLFHRHAITADQAYGGAEEQRKIIAKAIGL